MKMLMGFFCLGGPAEVVDGSTNMTGVSLVGLEISRNSLLTGLGRGGGYVGVVVRVVGVGDEGLGGIVSLAWPPSGGGTVAVLEICFAGMTGRTPFILAKMSLSRSWVDA
jgi:hypothetical protein